MEAATVEWDLKEPGANLISLFIYNKYFLIENCPLIVEPPTNKWVAFWFGLSRLVLLVLSRLGGLNNVLEEIKFETTTVTAFLSQEFNSCVVSKFYNCNWDNFDM